MISSSKLFLCWNFKLSLTNWKNKKIQYFFNWHRDRTLKSKFGQMTNSNHKKLSNKSLSLWQRSATGADATEADELTHFWRYMKMFDAVL